MEETVLLGKNIALKHVEAMLKEQMVLVAFPMLKLAVEKSATKIDDMVLGALEEPMKAAALELIEKIYQGA
jgi:hypothetical protein